MSEFGLFILQVELFSHCFTSKPSCTSCQEPSVLVHLEYNSEKHMRTLLLHKIVFCSGLPQNYFLENSFIYSGMPYWIILDTFGLFFLHF